MAKIKLTHLLPAGLIVILAMVSYQVNFGGVSLVPSEVDSLLGRFGKILRRKSAPIKAEEKVDVIPKKLVRVVNKESVANFTQGKYSGKIHFIILENRLTSLEIEVSQNEESQTIEDEIVPEKKIIVKRALVHFKPQPPLNVYPIEGKDDLKQNVILNSTGRIYINDNGFETRILSDSSVILFRGDKPESLKGLLFFEKNIQNTDSPGQEELDGDSEDLFITKNKSSDVEYQLRFSFQFELNLNG